MELDRRTTLRAAAGAAGLVAAGTAAGRLFVGGGASPSALVAGSLQRVANAVGGAAVEAHGSVTARRLVTEGARDPDAMALADPVLFEGIADVVVDFATNALAIAYDPGSEHADALRRDWTAALRRESIDVGRTDPAQDPLGYRTVMALRLAAPLGVDPDAALDRTSVLPETALMRALEAGELDAAFAYRNMAVEHGLPRVDLPASVDFSDPDRADHYATVTVDIDGRTVRGAPIVYAAAALTDRGRPWVEALTRSHGVLRGAGFSVPEGFPEEREVRDPGRGG